MTAVTGSKGQPNTLPPPPLKKDLNESPTSEMDESIMSDEGASPIKDESISIVSGQSSDVDYSNPDRRLVYQGQPQKQDNLDVISEISEVPSTETKTQTSFSENIPQPSLSTQKEITLNFSDEETESALEINKTPSVQIIEEIQPQKEKTEKIQQDVSKLKPMSSDDSFNISDLSEVSDAPKQVNPKTTSKQDSFSDIEDDDQEILESKVTFKPIVTRYIF